MSQSVVIEYFDERGESLSRLVEPFSIVWKPLEGCTYQQWLLLAWLYPEGEFVVIPMASIHGWTPVMGDDEEEAL